MTLGLSATDRVGKSGKYWDGPTYCPFWLFHEMFFTLLQPHTLKLNFKLNSLDDDGWWNDSTVEVGRSGGRGCGFAERCQCFYFLLRGLIFLTLVSVRAPLVPTGSEWIISDTDEWSSPVPAIASIFKKNVTSNFWDLADIAPKYIIDLFPLVDGVVLVVVSRSGDKGWFLNLRSQLSGQLLSFLTTF